MDKQMRLDEIQKELETQDLRLTRQREAVARVLLGNMDDHLRAEDIYLLAKEVVADIGLATVYRTLEIFENLDIVYRLEYGDGQSRYEIGRKSDKHYHHHLICTKCGSINEFNDDLLEELEAKIAEQEEFEIIDHSLSFFGYCKKCQSKNGSKK